VRGLRQHFFIDIVAPKWLNMGASISVESRIMKKLTLLGIIGGAAL
jgi:hypothetical protein